MQRQHEKMWSSESIISILSEAPAQLPVPFRCGTQNSKSCQWHDTFSKRVQDSENWDCWQDKQMLAKTDVIFSGTRKKNKQKPQQYSKLKLNTLQGNTSSDPSPYVNSQTMHQFYSALTLQPCCPKFCLPGDTATFCF